MRVREPQNIYLRRRLTALGVLLVLVVIAGVLIGSGDGGEAPEPKAARDVVQVDAPSELPRGGRSVLPEHRVVAFYGAPQSNELGVLGIGEPDRAARRLARQAKPYGTKQRPALPALELITVIANADAGDDGMYRARQEDAVIGRYLRAARRAKALLLLDIQPGRADFFTETTRLERWLKEPDVGLALDPEWRVREGEVPGQVIGHVEAREVNATCAWLAKLVAQEKLPEKLVVIHQFTEDMVDETALKARDGLAIVLNADGFGGRAVKRAKYHAFTREEHGFYPGFKLFYEEDENLMSPRSVLRLKPPPDFVVYE